MLVDKFIDKEKNIPEGSGVEIDGVAFRRSRGMIYWYRWGRHSLDIRVLRQVLGLPKETEADKYFMPGNKFYEDGNRALSDHVSAINAALNGRSFKLVIKDHDKIVKSEKW